MFIGLSLYWITVLIRVINRPIWHQVIIQAVLLFFIFKLRFAALYYPVISVIALIICRRPWWFKTAGIALTILPIAFEIQHTISVTRKVTGTAIFSAFSGWQIANNALNMYPYIKVNTSALPSRDCIELDSIVRKYFNTYHTAGSNAAATTDYMWNSHLPLKTYMNYRMSQDKNLTWFKAWHRVAPVYTEYGYSLIKKHPVAYARYYLWPTAITYLLPPIENLGIYNEGKDSVSKIAQNWFWYKSTRVTSVSKTFQRLLIAPYTYLFLALNIIFGWLLIALLVKRRAPATIIFIGILWIVHGCFNIFSTPVIYRYQHFAFIVLFAFSLIALEQLTKYYLSNKPGSIK
jgi:hypothetical protein